MRKLNGGSSPTFPREDKFRTLGGTRQLDTLEQIDGRGQERIKHGQQQDNIRDTPSRESVRAVWLGGLILVGRFHLSYFS